MSARSFRVFNPYSIICGGTTVSVLFVPFKQNQKNIANKMTSPESLCESYNQTLLLTQILQTENITAETHPPKQTVVTDSVQWQGVHYTTELSFISAEHRGPSAFGILQGQPSHGQREMRASLTL